MKTKKFKKLISYYKPYKASFFTYLSLSFVTALILVAIPVILKHITNNVIFLEHTAAFQNIFWLAALILILIGLANKGCYYCMYCGSVMGTNIENDMRNEIFQHFQKLPHKFFDNHETGELMSRITTDLNNLSKFLHRFPEEVFHLFVRFVGVNIVFCVINWKLALITTLLVPVVCIYIMWFMPKLTKAFKKNLKTPTKISSIVKRNHLKSLVGAFPECIH